MDTLDRLLGTRCEHEVGRLETHQEGGSFPLTRAQSKLWASSNGAIHQNVVATLRIAGALDQKALREALHAAVARNEALRLAFIRDGRGPQQYVRESAVPCVEITDCSRQNAVEQEAVVARAVQTASERQTSTEEGVSLWAHLIELDRERVLILSAPALALDEYSLHVLVGQVLADYAARKGDAVDLADRVPLSLRDIVVWEGANGSAVAGDSEQPPVLELPTTARRDDARSEPREAVLLFPSPLLTGLRRVADAERVTVTTVLFAAFASLLHRYSPESDVVIWLSDGERRHPGSEALLGCLDARTPVRFDPRTATSFREILTLVRAALSTAAEATGGHSWNADRERYQVGFTARGEHLPRGRNGGEAVLTDVHITRSEVVCDLELRIDEGIDGTVHGVLVYAADAFDPAAAARIAGHFESLLHAVASNPLIDVSDVDVLTEQETRRLIHEWDHTADDTPLEALHTLFEKQTRATPHAVAITFDGNEITYEELNAQSNRVAHALLELSVVAEQPIAVLLENGPQQVVAMFAVLKAGGAFVCLDPVHPTKRLREVLDETGTTLLIAESNTLERHPDLDSWWTGAGNRLVQLDLDEGIDGSENAHERYGRAFLAARSQENPDVSVDPAATAYIVYTSGSTGKPKGIVQTHRSFCQFLIWQSEHFGIVASERWAQWASIAYDASYCEIFGTLCVGATLCMAHETVRFDPGRLVDWVRREQVTILQVVPSFCRELVQVWREQSEPEEGHPLPNVRALLLAGEVLPVDLAKTLLEAFPHPPQLHNLYGPSECVLATHYHVTSVAADQTTVSVGSAIRGRQILILDPHGRLCPIGVRGEIYIRSPYLTRGYFERPAETAARFIQNPLHDDFPDPVFRTGDMARWCGNGTIEFFGRRDNLVKLRGIRVELGDVEAAVRRHESVADCAAVVRRPRGVRTKLVAKEREARAPSHREGPQVLVAYYTARRPVPGSELRTFLEGELPPHMIPHQLLQLDALPLNANRKLDVHALPEPDFLRPELKQPFVPPTTDRERLLVEVWREILGLDRVGVHDGFFELGGDSLLAMQVLNRTRDATGIPISFRDLFEHGTVAELAARLDALEASGDGAALVPARDADRSSYPLSHAQQGVWFLWRLEPQNPFYTAQGTIHIDGPVDVEILRAAWRAVIDRHEVLRARFATEDGEPVQSFDDRRAEELPLIDLTDLAPSERLSRMHAMAREWGQQALDLEQDALLQPRLFKLGDERYELLITFHEIILDLWGISVIVNDLGQYYAGFQAGGEESVKSLEVGFADYLLWERERLTRDAMEAQESFWRSQLSGELPVLNLPTDRSRSNTPNYRGAARSIMLDTDLSRALRTTSTEANATLFMTLLAASYVLLRAYTGQHDIILGSPIANRTDARTERLVGFFLNMLPLRADLADDPTFAELLHHVRQTVTGAMTNADYPFAWMAEGTRTARDTSVAPVFQVMFNMLNLPHSTYEFGGLTLGFSEVDTGYTKYDMSFYAQEQGDRLFFQIAYLTALFDHETVERMVANYEILLRNIVRNPATRISELELLSPGERDRVLVELNQTDRSVDLVTSLPQLFEEQAARTPDATALIFEGRTCTYADLNRQANQLARYLQQHGVKKGVRVGLCVGRSFDTIVTILGVLKAGGSYVALEPTYPVPRLEAILNDAQPAVLVVHEVYNRFERFAGTTVVLDGERSAIASMQAENLGIATPPEHTLNVVYTSASTGIPKGALIPARAVLNRLRWMWEDHPFHDGDVALLQKSYALVAATWECFGGLLKGIPTVILSQDEIIDAAAIWGRLVEHGVTHVLASPPFFEGLLDQAEAHPGAWQTLRLATTSAEPIPVSMINRWRRVFPDVPLLNLYGSTECSSNVTCYDTSDLPADASRVPVGHPLPNTRVYVLDDALRPTPIGAVGEMCVAGACLAEGYLNLDELTDERFVDNPYGDGLYGKLFRTGDLVRMRHDGNLELIGRKDHQVKVRGFRVELADIEEALQRHESVRRCAAVLDDSNDRRRLVAYVVTDGGTDQSTLWEFLRGRLPDYMVPAHFVFLDSLPLTPNGKVNRQALPAPDPHTATGAAVRPPTTPSERLVHRLWQAVLEVEHLGIDDNFFELGGHSLLATRLVSSLRDRFQNEIPVRLLFEHPTVARLVHALAPSFGGMEGLDEIAQAILEVEQLSDDEVRAQLSAESEANG